MPTWEACSIGWFIREENPLFYRFSCTLYNCALVGNSAGWEATDGRGGGAYGSTLYNCILSGNSSANYGGGACNSTLHNCILSGNSSTNYGGGACWSELHNCTLTGNAANAYYSAGGGGAYQCTLDNCILYFNTAGNYDTSDSPSLLNNCCTVPMPTNGVANITNNPLFVDYTRDNLRLQTNSPCINRGSNAYVSGGTDLDGRPRIVGGTVNMGAYEFQAAGMGEFIGWLQQYGLPTDGSAGFADPDHDGMNNWQEWICGTCPTDATSVLILNAPVKSGPGLTVTWQSVDTRTYYLQRATNLSGSPAFLTIHSNIPGQASTTTYTDTNAVGPGPFFYRLGVNSP